MRENWEKSAILHHNFTVFFCKSQMDMIQSWAILFLINVLFSSWKLVNWLSNNITTKTVEPILAHFEQIFAVLLQSSITLKMSF